MDSVYGDKGLDHARRLFASRADLDIEQGLRDRYHAGIFRIRDFRQNQDAISIILLARGQALRPCRAAAKS